MWTINLGFKTCHAENRSDVMAGCLAILMARRTRGSTVKYSAGEIGRVRVVKDFLPAQVPREENVKVTLSPPRRRRQSHRNYCLMTLTRGPASDSTTTSASG
jgi:hypothetical protein